MVINQISKDKTDTLNKHLNDLLFFAPPKELRKSVHSVFFSCLTQKDFVASDNFTEISTDFFFLINFLQNIEDEMDKKTTPNSGLPKAGMTW